MSDIKLRKAILPLSLKESENKIIAMSKILSDFGTRTITLVHIKTGSNRKSQHIQEKLRSYAQRIKELNFDPEIKISHSNNITQGIYNTSYEVGAEFICIIWKAKGVIKKTLLGSKTIDTIRHINLPIFIFKQRNPLVKHCSLNSILYATDFKKTDSIVIPYLNNSEITASNLYFLHVRNRAPDPETEKLQ